MILELPHMPGANMVTRTPNGRLVCVFPAGGMHMTRALVTVGPTEPDTILEDKLYDESYEFEELKAAKQAVLDWTGEGDMPGEWKRKRDGKGVTKR